MGRQGTWAARDPDVADEFARMAAEPGTGGGSAGPNIVPLLHRANNAARLTLSGEETDRQIAATLSHAFDELGHDAVMLRNYTSPEGKTGREVLVVRDPSQLRSPYAAFDPDRVDSADLLASRVPFAPIGLLNQQFDNNRDSAWLGSGGI